MAFMPEDLVEKFLKIEDGMFNDRAREALMDYILAEVWPVFVKSANRYGRQHSDQTDNQNTKDLVNFVLPKLMAKGDYMDKIHQLLYINDPNGYMEWAQTIGQF